MKLKTLTEILPCTLTDNLECNNFGEDCEEECIACSDKNDLRQEAIKWIKELQNVKVTERPDKNYQIIDWIKHFFNIKDSGRK